MSQRKASTRQRQRPKVGTSGARQVSIWLNASDASALAFVQKRMGLSASVALRMALWRYAMALGAPVDRT